MNRRQVVRAIFRPTRAEDLCSESAAAIGTEVHFIAAMLVDGGPYDGQFEMWVAENRGDGYWTYGSAPFSGWVPEEDLEILEVVDPGVDDNWQKIGACADGTADA